MFELSLRRGYEKAEIIKKRVKKDKCRQADHRLCCIFSAICNSCPVNNSYVFIFTSLAPLYPVHNDNFNPSYNNSLIMLSTGLEPVTPRGYSTFPICLWQHNSPNRNRTDITGIKILCDYHLHYRATSCCDTAMTTITALCERKTIKWQTTRQTSSCVAAAGIEPTLLLYSSNFLDNLL